MAAANSELRRRNINKSMIDHEVEPGVGDQEETLVNKGTDMILFQKPQGEIQNNDDKAVITNAGNIPLKTLQPATSSSSCGCPHTTPPPMCNCNPPDHSHVVTEDLIANPWRYPFTKCCMKCMAIMEILTQKLDCCKRKWCTVLSGDYKTVRVVEIIETTEEPDSLDPDPTHPPGHTHRLTQHVLDNPEDFLFDIGCSKCDETLELLIQTLDNKPKCQKFKDKMKALKQSIARAFCSKAKYADDVIVEEYK